MESTEKSQLLTVKDCLNLKVWGTVPNTGERFFSSHRWKQKTLKEWMEYKPPAADAIREAYLKLPFKDDGTRDKHYNKNDNPYAKLKENAPAFQFAHGARSKSYLSEKKENGDSLIKASDLNGVYAIDIDDVPEDQLQECMMKLLRLPEVFSVALSVSGAGCAAFMAYDMSGAPDADADADAIGDYMQRVFESCADYVDDVFGAPVSDRSAKNPVRWRVCCPSCVFKPDDTLIKRVSIKSECAKKPKTKKKLKTAAAALRGTSENDKEERNTRLQALIFAAFDEGLSDDETTQKARETLAEIAPDSSRLNGDEMARLVSDLRSKWEKKQSKSKPRDIARGYCEGYKYDTFKGVIITPQGKETTLDATAAEFSRRNSDVSLNCAVESLITMVKENPAAQFDGLEKRVRDLASYYTEADAGAIDAYADRCGYDEYERRRLRLWLYEVCGRALKRGEKTDCMLVLAGHTEGTKKTMFFDAISSVLTGTKAAAYNFGGGKDSDLLLSHAAVVVVDELDKVLRKTDVAELKAKITQTHSCVRAAYERDAKNRLNSAVFGATTNEEHPIPAGENEARRYWVLNVKRPVNFLSTAEATSVMRAAAFDTLSELETYAAQYDTLTVVGKLWVQTPEEERETAERNGSLKMTDSPTIAIQIGMQKLRHLLPQPAAKILHSASLWGAVFETGEAANVGLSVNSWTPSKAKAADICKLIGARCKRRSTTNTENGVRKSISGFSLADIAAEFLPGEQMTTQNETFDDFQFA